MDLGIHNVVSVAQTVREHDDFRCTQLTVTDKSGAQFYINLYSAKPLTFEVSPARVVVVAA
jgi:hypothetical protein